MTTCLAISIEKDVVSCLDSYRQRGKRTHVVQGYQELWRIHCWVVCVICCSNLINIINYLSDSGDRR